MNTEDRRYQEAKERVRHVVGFYAHLVAYVVVNALLVFINLTTSPDVLWFFWPLLGWGIGIAMHALYVFGLGHWFGRDWEERKIQQMMDQVKE